MKKLLLLILAIGPFILMLIFNGCENPAERVVESTNSHFKVELLFEHDGVKVYRFFDNGRFIYYTNARGQTSYHTGGKHDNLIETESLK